MRERWTAEEAWAWYNAKPWINGCNWFVANARMLDVWQNWGHEEAMKVAEREIALAASLGLNSFRMMLPYREVWEQEHDSTMAHFEELLSLMDRYGITMMPVIGNDCLLPKDKQRPPIKLGPPEPRTATNVTPFDGTDAVGWRPEDDPANWPEAEAWVMDFVNRYRDDERIYMWNIWNEAGNSNRAKDMISLPFIKRLFYLLREADVTHPLTADVWGLYEQVEGRYNWKAGLDPLEQEMIELSDVITFHYYGDWIHCRNYIKMLQQFDRPILNTEWLHRPWSCFIATHLPLFKKYNVGSYFFCLVNGKYANWSQVWNWIKDDDRIDRSLWMHGIFDENYQPYDQDDIDAFMEIKAQMES